MRGGDFSGWYRFIEEKVFKVFEALEIAGSVFTPEDTPVTVGIRYMGDP